MRKWFWGYGFFLGGIIGILTSGFGMMAFCGGGIIGFMAAGGYLLVHGLRRQVLRVPAYAALIAIAIGGFNFVGELVDAASPLDSLLKEKETWQTAWVNFSDWLRVEGLPLILIYGTIAGVVIHFVGRNSFKQRLRRHRDK